MIRKLLARFIAWALAASPPPPPVATPRSEIKISESVRMRSALGDAEKQVDLIERYVPPVKVIPVAQVSAALAMDFTPYDYVNETYMGLTRFRGYPYLAMLAQVAEYRKMSATLAKYMTKKFIKVTSSGEGDHSERIGKIEAALIKFKVQDVLRRCAEMDGLYGRGQIYIDVKSPSGNIPSREDNVELLSPLLHTSAKIKKDSLIGFTPIEPVWTYPAKYSSTDPLRPDYYKPSEWFVMGKTLHASRLLMMVSREVPDLLKASYNFGGLSLSQLAEPAVNNWLRTRDSVSDMVHSFSINGIRTNMGSALAGGDGADLFDRIDMFNSMRDNKSAFVLDKDTEEFFQFNTPLTGLGELQSQAQEQPAAVCSIPLVFLLGITPSGLNATSEGEIEVFFSDIGTMQHVLFDDPLRAIFDVIQLSECGDIDPDIGFEYVQLSEMDLEQAANIEKTKADTDQVLVTLGAIAPEEVRDRLIADEGNAYHGLTGTVPKLDDNKENDDDEATASAD